MTSCLSYLYLDDFHTEIECGFIHTLSFQSDDASTIPLAKLDITCIWPEAVNRISYKRPQEIQ